MKNKKCPEKKFCFGYKDNNCEGCAFGNEITKLHKRIDRLKKQNETLTIQRNAWALIAKRLTEEGKWISVEDNVPDTEVIAINMLKGTYGYEEMLIGYVFPCASYESGYGAENDYVTLENVTHWMPLPEPPKGNEDTE